MDGFTTIFKDPNILTAIKLIDFKDFLQLGTFPRYPQNKDLTITLEQLPIEKYNKSLIVFISHCWLRGWNGAEGWDGRPHPDNVDGGKYRLCSDGISQIKESLAPGMEDCYIWLDFGCIDQDGNPAGELRLLDKIVQVCDCIFSPIYDAQHTMWNYPLKGWFNYFTEYKSPAWNGTVHAYLNRGWCRVEMFYAANIPLIADSEERRNKMTAGLRSHRQEGRRPHILYGSKEKENLRTFLLLPPLQNSYFEEFHPEKGNLTKEADRDVIRSLVMELLPYMKNIHTGYTGDLKDGMKNGRGIFKYPNGDVYDGEWKDDQKHGHGKYKFVNGNIYNGEWNKDKMNGRGRYRFATNDLYDGEFKDGKMTGRGVYKYSNGNIYEGEYCDGRMHGFGIYRYTNGDLYEGNFKEGLKHGKGTFIYQDGEIYDGEYQEDKKHGKGSYKYASGDFYEGEYKDGKMHGYGVYHYSSGAVYEGEYQNGNMHGKGKYRTDKGMEVTGEWIDDKLVHRDKKSCIIC